SPQSPRTVAPVAEASPDQPAAKTGQSSNFRNVSACNRCRLRKNKCDQQLPSCASCTKAGVNCVGYDPITKREIPRSYVFFLEARVGYLESRLGEAGVPFEPPEALELASRPGPEPNVQKGDDDSGSNQGPTGRRGTGWSEKQDEEDKLDNLVSNVGMISVQGASDPRYLGSTSGISFARVVFAAVKSSVAGSSAERGGAKAPSAKVGPGGTSMRDSFFGLQTKPSIKPAPFPDRSLALRLVRFYFEHANPQIPILHRGEFMKMFDLVYGDRNHVRTPRESYILNIVFAIGAGIYLGDPNTEPDAPPTDPAPNTSGLGSANRQCQPEEYHASAIMHLEACLQSTGTADRPEGFGGGLEELQAVLLLAGFALLRPVAPGLWYITGVAVRIALDLGLHYEDGKDIDAGLREQKAGKTGNGEPESYSREKGRREWIRDFRRRLWWSTYSFDRLVSTCVGRPFGISDHVITTSFPSLLEDKYVTPHGFLTEGAHEPSSKHVAHHYFRFRLLQSEILQVLQHQQAQAVRATSTDPGNSFLPAQQASPFLAPFGSFRAWRLDIDARLWAWKTASPTRRESGVQFSHEFLELNYWQAVLMVYRQSLSVPTQFAEEFDGAAEVGAGAVGEGEEAVFLKVAEAGQRTMDEVDFNILAATSVLGDLVEKCPPAEACRDAFDRMAKATVQMCMSTSSLSAAPGLAPPRAPDAPVATPAPRPRLQFGSPGDLYTASPSSGGGSSGGVKSEGLGVEGAEPGPREHIIDPTAIPGEERSLPFLDDGGMGVEGGDAYGGYEDIGMSDMNGMEYMGDAGGGLELGFGWGAEGDGHDFGDGGNQLDFFDGFYFGTGV
ncbi:hypothetical protein V493_06911, partial [Pseudogymnoascus sp. VKM F-4281 (FW-2241)]